MELEKVVAKNVKKYREGRKLTQEQLARKTGFSQRYINKIENQAIDLGLKTLRRLADALDISPAELVSEGKLVATNKTAVADFDGALDLLKDLRSKFVIKDEPSGSKNTVPKKTK